MATTITKTIGSAGGRDYATIQAWMDAIPNNLVTADEVWVGELYNDSEFTASSATLGHLRSGITTDATRYIQLRPATGQGFKSAAGASTAPLRYDQTKGAACRITNNYAILFDLESPMWIDGVQMYYNSAYASNYFPPVLIRSGVTGVAITNFILEFDRTGGSCLVVAGPSTVLANGLVVARGATFSGLAVAFDYSSGSSVACNLSVVRPSNLTAGGTGISRANSMTVVATNCAVFGFSTMFSGTFDAASGNNASSVASGSIPGSSNQASLTYSSQFQNVTDATRDWRPSGALPNNGSRQQTYTSDLDIIGAARSTSTPTIGAREVAAAATVDPGVIFGSATVLGNPFYSLG